MKAMAYKRMPWSALWDPETTEDEQEYIQRRAHAVTTRDDVDIVLLDPDTGEVARLFWQHCTVEPDTAAYERALSPPYDASMERFNNMPSSAAAWRSGKNGRRRRRR